MKYMHMHINEVFFDCIVCNAHVYVYVYKYKKMNNKI